jgi:Flp pilus assembly protein TadD
MKTRKFNILALTAITGAFLYNCSVMKDVEYTVNPNPVEMHGDEITVNIDGKFIEKGLNSKASVELTPTLINKEGNELDFDMTAFKGGKAEGNGEIVKKDGHSFSYTSKRPYDPAFENSELVIKYIAKKGGKEKLNDVTPKVADATIVTPLLLQNDDKVVYGEDKLIRSTEESTTTVINYEKAKFNVRAAELKQQDILDFEKFLVDGQANTKIVFNGVNILSYASPEGEMDKNNTLAEDRATSAEAYLNKVSTKLNIQGINMTKSPKGEDWDGLKELISASTHEDKNIIIRVAEMNGNPAQREAEIKTLSSTYKFLDKDIFPQLRRSQMTLNYTLNGYTDEELKTLSASNPQSLTAEEILFTANTLTNDLNTKLALYNEAITKAPEDWRGYNNAGVILYSQGKVSDAKTKFTKANELDKNPITNNNYGAMLRRDGKIDEAAALFSSSTAAGEEVNYNLSLVNIKKGEYDQAVTNAGSYNTFNKALALTLKKDYAAAISTLDKSDDKASALGDYLRAIIAARKGSDTDVFTNLKNAITKDSSLKDKAKNDRVFVKYFSNAAFIALF